MRKNGIAIAVSTTLIILLWLITGWSSFDSLSFMGMRNGLIQLSGVIAMWLLTVSVILAARPRFLEPAMSGLDSMYHVHKWIGILGIALSVFHWFMATGFKVLFQLGIMSAPSGGPEHRMPPPDMGSLSLLQRLSGAAREAGSLSFYIMLALGLIALVTIISYKLFALSHRLESLIFLGLVFHSSLLFTREYWLTPIGIFSALFLAIGAVCALLILFRVTNRIRSTRGKVSSITRYPALKTLIIEIEFEGRWKGHETGQFAFVRTCRFEAPHPFTISTNWNGDGKIGFFVKELGDYTGKLPEDLKVGLSVSIEGPYGRFNFADDKEQQIWIGAGVGITPFAARMKELAGAPDRKKITLYHPTSQIDEEAFAKMKEDAESSGVDLRIWESRQKGRLSAGRIMSDIPGWKDASIWFCGPDRFLRHLWKDFHRAGVKYRDFHHELFKMR